MTLQAKKFAKAWIRSLHLRGRGPAVVGQEKPATMGQGAVDDAAEFLLRTAYAFHCVPNVKIAHDAKA
jgi:hypothetical protein